MAEIGIRELRGDLAAIVRRAAGGERTVVTVGGRAAAQLGPLASPSGHEVTFADLEARGLIQPPRRTGPGREAAPVSVWRGMRLDRLLAEIRG